MLTYYSELDDHFKISVLQCTAIPEYIAWLSMHQCYSEDFVGNNQYNPAMDYGSAVVRHLLQGNKGHYSPLEHNSITLAVGGYPHSVMQQYRTHRVGISFSVQSTRYTGERVIQYLQEELSFDDVFYLRKPGEYHARDGKYTITETDYDLMRESVHNSAEVYCMTYQKYGEAELSRYVLPYSIRQHFVMTVNARSLMHLLDLRHKPDAELESQDLAVQLFRAFFTWMPSVASWYEQKRLNKGILAP